MSNLDNLTQTSHPAYFYQPMLADHTRMERYRRAIAATVRPGDTVADLGTGTGVLAIMAAQCGAARVYAIDRRPLALAVAERVIRANGVSEQVRLIEGDVSDVQLEGPVDVVLNELLGDFGTDEGIYESVDAFVRRHLAAGGRILPSHLRTLLVAAEYGPEFRGVYRRDFHGVDLRAANSFPCLEDSVMAPLNERPVELAAPLVLEDIRFGPDMPPRPTERAIELEIVRHGELQGFVGAFEATLAPGIEIGNYPCYPGCHWSNWHWPLAPPQAVTPGQRVRGLLQMPLSGAALGWKLEWRLD